MSGQKVQLPEPSSSISKNCIEIISKCLSYKPSERPSFEQILTQMRENSYELAQGVDPLILSMRDKELEYIEKYK